MEKKGRHYIPPSSVNEPVQERKVRRNKLRRAINTYEKDSQSKVQESQTELLSRTLVGASIDSVVMECLNDVVSTVSESVDEENRPENFAEHIEHRHLIKI